MNEDALGAASEIAAVFESLNVPYMIGGSVASTVWGEPRFTLDVDFVCALKSDQILPLKRILGDAWYADESAIREAVSKRSSFNMIRLKRMVKVDVFVPPDTGFDASKWKRVRYETLDPGSPHQVCVTSPEDIVLQKLRWFRSDGEVSDNQWRDVTALLRIQAGRLDEEYLDNWAKQLELLELLDRARVGRWPESLRFAARHGASVRIRFGGQHLAQLRDRRVARELRRAPVWRAGGRSARVGAAHISHANPTELGWRARPLVAHLKSMTRLSPTTKLSSSKTVSSGRDPYPLVRSIP